VSVYLMVTIVFFCTVMGPFLLVGQKMSEQNNEEGYEVQRRI
jgi:hypothetical protein